MPVPGVEIKTPQRRESTGALPKRDGNTAPARTLKIGFAPSFRQAFIHHSVALRAKALGRGVSLLGRKARKRDRVLEPALTDRPSTGNPEMEDTGETEYQPAQPGRASLIGYGAASIGGSGGKGRYCLCQGENREMLRYCYRPRAQKRLVHKIEPDATATVCLLVSVTSKRFEKRYEVTTEFPPTGSMCAYCREGFQHHRVEEMRQESAAANEMRKRAKVLRRFTPKPAKPNKAPKVFDLAWAKSNEFLQSYEWRSLRMLALTEHGSKCMACGATPAHGVRIHVDHIKPRKLYPELALSLKNLQVLCEECNHGKGNWDQTDWRDANAGLTEDQAAHMREIMRN